MTAYEEDLINNRGYSPEEASILYQKYSDPGFSYDPVMMREYQPGFSLVPREKVQQAAFGDARPVTVAPDYLQKIMQAGKKPQQAPVRVFPTSPNVGAGLRKKAVRQAAKRINQNNAGKAAFLSPAAEDRIKEIHLKDIPGGAYNSENGVMFDPVSGYFKTPEGETVIAPKETSEQIQVQPQTDALQDEIANTPLSWNNQPEIEKAYSALPESSRFQEASNALGTEIDNYPDLAHALDTDETAIGNFGIDLRNPEHVPVSLPEATSDDKYDMLGYYSGQGAALLGSLYASPYLTSKGLKPVADIIKDWFKPKLKALPEKIGGESKLVQPEEVIRGPFNRGRFNPYEYFTKVSSRKREAAMLENYLGDLMRTGKMSTGEYLIRMQRISEALKNNLPIK